MLAPDTILQNRYLIRSPIGQGGMGTVYLAADQRLGDRQVAVKELSLLYLPLQEQPWRVQQFQQEATLLAQLDHPGIAGVSDYFVETGNVYVVMEYVPDPTLNAWLDQFPQRQAPATAVNPIVQQLCQVLDYLHSQNPPIIFRDLKPVNVIVQPDGQVKLIDFGIARFFKSGKTSDTRNLGTPGYAAPELYGRGQSDSRADIYSLGVLTYEMLTGYDPSTTPMNLPPLSRYSVIVSPQMAAAVTQATQPDPARRQATVKEFCDAMMPTAVKGTKSIKWVAVAVPVILLLLAVAVGLIFWPDANENDALGLSTPMIEDEPLPTAVVEVLITATNPPATPTLNPTAPPPTDTPESTATLLVTAVATETPTPIFDTPIPSPVPLPTLTGNGLMQLTIGPYLEYTPALSPDQQRLVLVSKINDLWQVVEADPHGSGWTSQITNEAANFYNPRFSPDGRSLLVSSDRSGDEEIYLMDAGSGAILQQLTNSPRRDFYAYWLPDGDSFIFTSDRNGQEEVFRGYLDGSSPTRLTFDDRFDGFAAPSTDGTQITFYSNREGDYEVYVMDVYGGNIRQLTNDPARDASPIFSPDGEWIAFESNRSGTYDIYLVPSQGGAAVNVTNHPANDWVPAFSADGQWLFFQSDRDGDMNIYRLPVE